MRGSGRSYGCPWYEYPGSMASNFNCGLCSECFKGCPYENVGLAVRPPLTDVYAPRKKRFDVAFGVTLLIGLVFFQVFNATAAYGALDGWLNRVTGWIGASATLFGAAQGYPNPLDYLGIIALLPLLLWGWSRLAAPVATREVFTRYAYGWIPLFAMAIFARQMPKFLTDAPVVLKTLADPFGFGWNLIGTAHVAIQAHAFAPTWILGVQLACVAAGLAASLYATGKITALDFSDAPTAGRVNAMMLSAVVILGVALMALFYVIAATDPGHFLSPPF